MFDIGFAEIVIISIVALLVLGPERLPSTVRSIALWIGRLKRGFASVKSEIEREIGADDIRRQLHNESVLKDLSDTGRDIQSGLSRTQADINRSLQAESLDVDVKSYQADSSADTSEAVASNSSKNDSSKNDA